MGTAQAPRGETWEMTLDAYLNLRSLRRIRWAGRGRGRGGRACDEETGESRTRLKV